MEATGEEKARILALIKEKAYEVSLCLTEGEFREIVTKVQK